MTTTPTTSTGEEASQAYYDSQIQQFRASGARLSGRKITYLNNEEKENAEWWNACRLYTGIALFSILLLVLIAIAIGVATKLLI